MGPSNNKKRMPCHGGASVEFSKSKTVTMTAPIRRTGLSIGKDSQDEAQADDDACVQHDSGKQTDIAAAHVH